MAIISLNNEYLCGPCTFRVGSFGTQFYYSTSSFQHSIHSIPTNFSRDTEFKLGDFHTGLNHWTTNILASPPHFESVLFALYSTTQGLYFDYLSAFFRLIVQNWLGLFLQLNIGNLSQEFSSALEAYSVDWGQSIFKWGGDDEHHNFLIPKTLISTNSDHLQLFYKV